MKSKYILAFATLFIAFSCEIYDLDINTDPNNPTKASLDLLLPTIQINWAYHYQSINDISAGIMGHTSNSDGLNFTQNSFDGLWSAIYLSEVSDLDEYVKAASLEDENGVLLTPGPLGVGKIYKAHIFSTLVDVFGDVPFTEAAQGNDDGNVAPAYDDQTAIYTACLTMLDEAIGHLSSTSLKVDGDMIYGGVTTRWLAAAYSMKLKLLMQVRNAPGFTYGTGVNAEIRDLIDNHAADLIGASSSKPSFAFNYNTNVALGQRHPWMGAVYSGDNSFSYIMHQLMYEMLINHDPRIAYYIKRQTTAELDQADASQKNTTPCSQNSACIYGYMVQNAGVMSELQAAGVITDVNGAADRAYVASFFGRDKGDPSGIPLDGPLRTAPGV
ncbi:MAG: SusD/RagB family nutrient-binding outer membrane lipoprotein, partial [Cyclobacteriaceae bacterium]|nr:SusD/RagB family nutrient-binding outer membrane lipoprotein [Cyclobacteriaceae bacterium]